MIFSWIRQVDSEIDTTACNISHLALSYTHMLKEDEFHLVKTFKPNDVVKIEDDDWEWVGKIKKKFLSWSSW